MFYSSISVLYYRPSEAFYSFLKTKRNRGAWQRRRYQGLINQTTQGGQTERIWIILFLFQRSKRASNMSDDYQAVGGVGWETLGGGWMALVRVFGSKAGGVFFIFREGFKHMQHVTLFFLCVFVWSLSFLHMENRPHSSILLGFREGGAYNVDFLLRPFFFFFSNLLIYISNHPLSPPPPPSPLSSRPLLPVIQSKLNPNRIYT